MSYLIKLALLLAFFICLKIARATEIDFENWTESENLSEELKVKSDIEQDPEIELGINELEPKIDFQFDPELEHEFEPEIELKVESGPEIELEPKFEQENTLEIKPEFEMENFGKSDLEALLNDLEAELEFEPELKHATEPESTNCVQIDIKLLVDNFRKDLDLLKTENAELRHELIELNLIDISERATRRTLYNIKNKLDFLNMENKKYQVQIQELQSKVARMEVGNNFFKLGLLQTFCAGYDFQPADVGCSPDSKYVMARYNTPRYHTLQFYKNMILSDGITVFDPQSRRNSFLD